MVYVDYEICNEVIEQRKHRTLTLISIVLILFGLGYLRDFIFTNINYTLYEMTNEVERSSVHSWFSFLKNYTQLELYNSKWVLTFLFTLVFMASATSIVYYIYRNRFFVKIVLGIYAFLSVLSGAFYAFGVIAKNMDLCYTISRHIIGLLHSPIILMVLCGSFYLSNQYNPGRE